MPLAGVHRIITGELTLKKKKGKELSKAQGEAFSPENVLKKNSEVGRKKGTKK